MAFLDFIIAHPDLMLGIGIVYGIGVACFWAGGMRNPDLYDGLMETYETPLLTTVALFISSFLWPYWLYHAGLEA